MGHNYTLLALLALIFLSGCGDEALKNAAHNKAMIEAARAIPDLPDDCRLHAKAGVAFGDRLDVAALKINHALRRQIARTDRCAGWYDELQQGVRQQE